MTKNEEQIKYLYELLQEKTTLSRQLTDKNELIVPLYVNEYSATNEYIHKSLAAEYFISQLGIKDRQLQQEITDLFIRLMHDIAYAMQDRIRTIDSNLFSRLTHDITCEMQDRIRTIDSNLNA